jgi:hypothetical protein
LEREQVITSLIGHHALQARLDAVRLGDHESAGLRRQENSAPLIVPVFRPAGVGHARHPIPL